MFNIFWLVLTAEFLKAPILATKLKSLDLNMKLEIIGLCEVSSHHEVK
jgi:hypothetical protein